MCFYVQFQLHPEKIFEYFTSCVFFWIAVWKKDLNTTEKGEKCVELKCKLERYRCKQLDPGLFAVCSDCDTLSYRLIRNQIRSWLNQKGYKLVTMVTSL